MITKSGHSRITAFLGALFCVAGGLCSPPGHDLLGFPPHALHRPESHLAAWLLCGGLALIGGALLWRRRTLVWELVPLGLGSTLAALALGETALWLAGAPPGPTPVPWVPPLSPTRQFDAVLGDRYTPGGRGGMWPVNAEGYVDLEDFRRGPRATATRRVLLLGDSNTEGIGAPDHHATWAMRLERGLNLRHDTVVWNTGIAGTGPAQYLAALREFLPRLQPDVVVLCFSQNDLLESLFDPAFMRVFDDGRWVYAQAVDRRGRVYEMPSEMAYRRALFAPGNIPEHLARTRAGHLALSALAEFRLSLHQRLHGHSGLQRDAPLPAGVDAARRQVGEMLALTRAHGAEFVAIVAPHWTDLAVPSARHEAAIGLFRDLGIAPVAVRDLFTPEDHDHTGHWMAAGQSKLAGLLQCELERIFAARPGSSRGGGGRGAGG